MRWILVSLLLLNLIYFGWGYWHEAGGGLESASSNSAGQVSSDDSPLILLTERLPAPGSASPPPSITPEKPKAQPPQIPVRQDVSRSVCLRIGPFDGEESRKALLAELVQAGLKAQSPAPEAYVTTQYWVMLPPYDTRRRALQTLRELQARKIDSYLVSSGDLKNAVSLGLFSREELAKGVQEKIREAGYPAEIRPKDKQNQRLWLLVIAEQPLENTTKSLSSLASRQSGIKISNTSCEMFAQ
ncbi:MAG: SPOR domain-containing protein [Gammaproteobacteria bacterium]